MGRRAAGLRWARLGVEDRCRHFRSPQQTITESTKKSPRTYYSSLEWIKPVKFLFCSLPVENLIRYLKLPSQSPPHLPVPHFTPPVPQFNSVQRRHGFSPDSVPRLRLIPLRHDPEDDDDGAHGQKEGAQAGRHTVAPRPVGRHERRRRG